MTVRTGMTQPIARLREMANAGTADYSISGTAYWTDAQLQDALDRYRQDLIAVKLEGRNSLDTGGTVRTYDYYFESGCYEEGTATFTVAKLLGGTVIPTTYNYETGHLQFAADQGGTAYYLSARKFDVPAAAADVWRQKASAAASFIDFSADGQSITRSELKKHYTEMADLCASAALPIHARKLWNDLF